MFPFRPISAKRAASFKGFFPEQPRFSEPTELPFLPTPPSRPVRGRSQQRAQVFWPPIQSSPPLLYREFRILWFFYLPLTNQIMRCLPMAAGFECSACPFVFLFFVSDSSIFQEPDFSTPLIPPPSGCEVAFVPPTFFPSAVSFNMDLLLPFKRSVPGTRCFSHLPLFVAMFLLDLNPCCYNSRRRIRKSHSCCFWRFSRTTFVRVPFLDPLFF